MTPHDLTRDHPDPLADALPPLVIDRQRVIHCAAFRRLQHKTQVFVAPESDHFRTRLTHSLEVAHQARVIASLLNLDADLAEIVALAHDLGHPPFGHAGEKALNDCLRDHGGFEHNRHTLRIVEELEHPYPDFYGLNLTHVVRECLAKHSTRYDQPGVHPLQDGQPPPAECQVVDLADRLTYALHDLQDGLYAGLIDTRELATLELWRTACTQPAAAADAWRHVLRPTIDRMQNRVYQDVVATALAGVPAPSPAVRVALSDELDRELTNLGNLLFARVYRSARLMRADAEARDVLSAVFEALVRSPESLPPRFAKRVSNQGVWRVVTDYVAGMTDRYCIDEYTRLCAGAGR